MSEDRKSTPFRAARVPVYKPRVCENSAAVSLPGELLSKSTPLAAFGFCPSVSQWEQPAHLRSVLLVSAFLKSTRDALSSAFAKCAICKVLWPTASLWLLLPPALSSVLLGLSVTSQVLLR